MLKYIKINVESSHFSLGGMLQHREMLPPPVYFLNSLLVKTIDCTKKCRKDNYDTRPLLQILILLYYFITWLHLRDKNSINFIDDAMQNFYCLQQYLSNYHKKKLVNKEANWEFSFPSLFSQLPLPFTNMCINFYNMRIFHHFWM